MVVGGVMMWCYRESAVGEGDGRWGDDVVL